MHIPLQIQKEFYFTSAALDMSRVVNLAVSRQHSGAGLRVISGVLRIVLNATCIWAGVLVPATIFSMGLYCEI
jgi:hypothetical protein